MWSRILGIVRIGMFLALVIFILTGGTVMFGPLGGVVGFFLSIALILSFLGLGIGRAE